LKTDKIKIPNKALLEFNRLLSLLLSSKIPVAKSLELIIDQTKNDNLKTVLESILKSIKAGNTLAVSFARYPTVFSDLYISQLKVGEETGALPEILLEFTSYQERFYDLQRKIMVALRYPLFVLTVAFCTVLFMLLFLIPSFESLFKSSKFELPALTKNLMAISTFIKDHYMLLSALIAIIGFTGVTLFKNKQFKAQYLDKLVLRIPYISGLYLKNLLARFSLTMGILLRNKVSLLESLTIAKTISDNSLYRKEMEEIRKRLLKGENFTSYLSKSKFFDPTFSQLLSVGEESAEMDKVFTLLYEYYDKEFGNTLENFSSLLEPMLIMVIGIIVSFVLIAMYLPMFEIANFLGV
jgi:type IV pilus assembly protein PilC